VGEFYTPGYERGLRYDDPILEISWPLTATEMSDKDRNWPLLESILIGV
jgi:dTDP-4-dehydrorhamnose 3,5-epimerase